MNDRVRNRMTAAAGALLLALAVADADRRGRRVPHPDAHCSASKRAEAVADQRRCRRRPCRRHRRPKPSTAVSGARSARGLQAPAAGRLAHRTSPAPRAPGLDHRRHPWRWSLVDRHGPPMRSLSIPRVSRRRVRDQHRSPARAAIPSRGVAPQGRVVVPATRAVRRRVAAFASDSAGPQRPWAELGRCPAIGRRRPSSGRALLRRDGAGRVRPWRRPSGPAPGAGAGRCAARPRCSDAAATRASAAGTSSSGRAASSPPAPGWCG